MSGNGNLFRYAGCGSKMKVAGGAKRCTGSNRKGAKRNKGCGRDRGWHNTNENVGMGIR